MAIQTVLYTGRARDWRPSRRPIVRQCGLRSPTSARVRSALRHCVAQAGCKRKCQVSEKGFVLTTTSSYAGVSPRTAKKWQTHKQSRLAAARLLLSCRVGAGSESCRHRHKNSAAGSDVDSSRQPPIARTYCAFTHVFDPTSLTATSEKKTRDGLPFGRGVDAPGKKNSVPG
jgi:hypothetical protein